MKEIKEIRIETAQDLIDAIAQHPQFREEVLRHLLTQDLLKLPAKFDVFQGKFESFQGEFESFQGKFDGFQGEFESFRGEVTHRLGNVEGDVSTLKGQVADLRGKDYERSIRFRVRERAKVAFALVDPKIALSQNDPVSLDLDRAINRARSRNQISVREIESLTDTDIILSDEQNSHVAVEISLTADERDLTRARERADLLYRITDGTVYAVIVGQTIPDELREKAADLNVAVMQIEYKG